MEIKKRTLEEIFDERLYWLYNLDESDEPVRSTEILLGYIAAILFEYVKGIDTRHISVLLLKLKKEGYIDFNEKQLKSTISVLLSKGAEGWADFLLFGYKGSYPSKGGGRPPKIYALKGDARKEIMRWRRNNKSQWKTFEAAWKRVERTQDE